MATLLQNLAALAYYDEKGIEGPAFEKLQASEQKPYADAAQKFLIYLDKLGLSPQKIIDTKKEEEQRNSRYERRVEKIKVFVQGLKHPPKVADFFPVEELARIMEDFK